MGPTAGPVPSSAGPRVWDTRPSSAKRAPATIREAAAVHFRCAQPGKMAVVDHISDIADQVQLGLVDLSPCASPAEDPDRRDELCLGLDTAERFTSGHCCTVAAGCRDLLTELGVGDLAKT